MLTASTSIRSNESSYAPRVQKVDKPIRGSGRRGAE